MFTGVNEEADLKSGIEIALKLHPDTRRIVFVNDTTTTGKKVHQKFLTVASDYQSRVRFEYLEDYTMPYILDYLKKLPTGSLVFYTLFFKDKAGRFFEYDESIRLISNNSPVPVYGTWDFSLGYGIVGGKLASGYYQGEAAANLALRILGGEKVENIPVILKSPNHYFFDFNQMSRFNISTDDLPEESIVINQPFSFISEHKMTIIAIFTGFLSLLMIVFLLSFNIIKRRQAEKNLKAAHDNLEHRVTQRTMELSSANTRLKTELEERHKAETALFESEKNYRELIENANSIIIRWDKTGCITFFNEYAENVLGYKKSEIIGKHFFEIIVPEVESTGKDLKESMNDICSNPENYRYHVNENLCKNGRRIWVAWTNKVFEDKKNGTTEVLSIGSDITEQMNAEAELKKKETLLRRAQKMEAIGTLAGGIAHDFNNLLYIISGNAEILMEDAPPMLQDGLEEIFTSARRGADLVKQLMTFSRKSASTLSTTYLNVEIRKVKKMLERLFPKMIEIQLDLEDDLYSINADQLQIEQILMNLCINARDSMPDSGKLTIKTENGFIDTSITKLHSGTTDSIDASRAVILSISDTGHGIPEEIQERIFEPFFSTKELGKGTGLGLSVIYGLVKAHNGLIFCDSKIGMGTTFTIYFPAVEGIDISNPLLPEADQAKTGVETILIVDDEGSVRRLSQAILHSLGYKSITADNGENALKVYAENRDKIDLVLLDLSMPGIGGIKCLEKLITSNPAIKVIIASGYSSKVAVKDSIKFGAKDYIIKPFTKTELSGVIRNVLDNE